MSGKTWKQKCTAEIKESLVSGDWRKAEETLSDYQDLYPGDESLDECVNMLKKVTALNQELQKCHENFQKAIANDNPKDARDSLKEYLIHISNDGSMLRPAAKTIVKRLDNTLEEVNLYELKDNQDNYMRACNERFERATQDLKQLQGFESTWWEKKAAEYAKNYFIFAKIAAFRFATESYIKIQMQIQGYVVADRAYREIKDNLSHENLKTAQVALEKYLSGLVGDLFELLINLYSLEISNINNARDVIRKNSERVAELKKAAPGFYRDSEEILEINSLIKQLKGSLKNNLGNDFKKISRTISKNPYNALNELEALEDDVNQHKEEIDNLIREYGERVEIRLHKMQQNAWGWEELFINEQIAKLRLQSTNIERLKGKLIEQHKSIGGQLVTLRYSVEDSLYPDIYERVSRFKKEAENCINSDVKVLDPRFSLVKNLYEILISETSERGIQIALRSKKDKNFWKTYKETLSKFKEKYGI